MAHPDSKDEEASEDGKIVGLLRRVLLSGQCGGDVVNRSVRTVVLTR